MDPRNERIRKHDRAIDYLLDGWGYGDTDLAQRLQKQAQVILWLENFQPSEIDDAMLLLSKLQVKTDHAIRHAITELAPEVARVLGDRLHGARFFPLGTSPSDSGGMYLYDYRRELGLSKEHFPAASVLDVADQATAIVFFDDIIGTGTQATQFYEDHSGTINKPLFYAAAFGFDRGIEAIREATGFEHVLAGVTLSDEERAFTTTSRVFPDRATRTRLQRLAEHYGTKLYPTGPLGYEDSQSLVVFPHNTPNNTLPIIWAGETNEKADGVLWNPVWPRRKREEYAIPTPLRIATAGPSLPTSPLRVKSYFHRELNSVSPASLPPELVVVGPFYGRQRELDDLRVSITPDAIVNVVGPPRIGKTCLIASLLADSTKLRSIGQTFGRHSLQVGLLIVPMNGLGVLEALSYALDCRHSHDLPDLDLDDTEAPLRAVDWICRHLTLQCNTTSLITVFDNAQRELLQSPTIFRAVLVEIHRRHGASIVVTETAPLPTDQRWRASQVTLGLFTDNEARETLAGILENQRLAESVAMLIANHQLRDPLFRPDVLTSLRTLRAGSDSLDTEDVLYSLIEATPDSEMLGLSRRFQAAGILFNVPGSRQCVHLCAAALLSGWLDADPIPLELRHSLRDYDLLTYEAGVPCLTVAAKAWLMVRVARSLKDEVHCDHVDAALAEALEQLIEQYESDHADTALQNQSDLSLADALQWLTETVPRAVQSREVLLQARARASANDIVFCLQPEAATEAVRQWAHNRREPSDSLRDSLARLSILVRFEKNATVVVNEVRRTVDVARAHDGLTGFDLKLLEVTSMLCARRHCRLEEIADIRNALTEKLVAFVDAPAPPEWRLVKWITSWHLNTAALYLRVGRRHQAREIAKYAERAIRLLPEEPQRRHARLDNIWLRARLEYLRAQLSVSSHLHQLQQLSLLTRDGVLLSEGSPLWVGRFCRAVQRELEDTSQPSDRATALATMLEFLVKVYGVRDDLELPDFVRTQAAAVLRETAAMGADQSDRLALAQQALRLIVLEDRPQEDSTVVPDLVQLIELARVYAFIGSCHRDQDTQDKAKTAFTRAKRVAKRAIEIYDSSIAWGLYLKVHDSLLVNPHTLTWSADWSVPYADIPKSLATEMAHYRDWRDKRPKGDMRLSVEMWCYSRAACAQGSLERWAKAKAHEADKNWKTLRPERRRAALVGCYTARAKALDELQGRIGKCTEVFLERFRLEAEYARLMAMPANNGNGVVDYTSREEIFSEARHQCPYEWRLEHGQGRFYRHIWDYERATMHFKNALSLAPRAENQREVRLNLAETLLTAGKFRPLMVLSSGHAAVDGQLLRDAIGYLAGLEQFPEIAPAVAVYRDLALLEMGEEIAWERIDALYDQVIGDDYVDTVIKNRDVLRSTELHEVTDLADAVRASFTDGEVLRGFGSLYLRGAEVSDDLGEVLGKCRRAFYVFDACRVLERSVFGMELPSTTFQKGRAILHACRRSESRSPLGVRLGKNVTEIEYARGRFESVRVRSVGLFQQATEERYQESLALAKILR